MAVKRVGNYRTRINNNATATNQYTGSAGTMHHQGHPPIDIATSDKRTMRSINNVHSKNGIHQWRVGECTQQLEMMITKHVTDDKRTCNYTGQMMRSQ
jgi:hypothetical protein